MEKGPMIQINGLTKTYTSGAKAVNGLDLEIFEGEIFSLLGPNGAGKSSTIKILTTLSGFDDGNVSVASFNVDVAPEKVRQSIGYVAQETGVDYFLTGRENLVLQGHLYRMTRKDIEARINELANYFSIEDVLDNLVSSYSGGMRRKLDIATALIHRPKVLFLDEPTLGLDTQSRQSLWSYIRKLNEELGLTILLTTHYLEEADKLSHRVAIINKGRIETIGNPEDLKNSISGDVVSLQFDTNIDKQAVRNLFHAEEFVKDTLWEEHKLHLYVNNGAASIPRLIELCNANQSEVLNVSYSHPTLDDVFIKYTGSSIDANQEDSGEKWWEKWAGKGGGKWAKQWQDQNPSDHTDDIQTKNNNEKSWSQEEVEAWHENKQWSEEDSEKWQDNKHWSKEDAAKWHSAQESNEQASPSADNPNINEWNEQESLQSAQNNSDTNDEWQKNQHWQKK